VSGTTGPSQASVEVAQASTTSPRGDGTVREQNSSTPCAVMMRSMPATKGMAAGPSQGTAPPIVGISDIGVRCIKTGWCCCGARGSARKGRRGAPQRRINPGRRTGAKASVDVRATSLGETRVSVSGVSGDPPDGSRNDSGAPTQEPEGTVRDVAMVFLRLGTIAFGGPAAHTAMMRDELVRRRGWVSDQRFVDLIGATNLIPGPNSTELAIHLGFDRARWRGLAAAGICFILPAALIVTALAWTYIEYGQTPAVEGILYGIVPAVIAIIAHALFGLLRTVVKSIWFALLAMTGLVAYLLGVNELVVLTAGALMAVAGRLARHSHPRHGLVPMPLLASMGQPVFQDPTGGQLAQLFGTMLKIGAVLYGSGYVLLAFLRGDFVDRLGWITEQQLIDAVSIGQVTPGPVFTTATFIGYLVAGPLGALLATLAIFLPSFVFVGLLTRLVDKLRSSAWTSTLLDGVNATALALMAGVSYQLGRTAIVDPLTTGIAVVTWLLLWKTSLNNAWYIGAGAAIGVAHTLLS
jgi:chromate transporter